MTYVLSDIHGNERRFASVMKQIDLQPEDTLYVGDHPFDITCAHDAGAAAAWLPPNRWYHLPEGSSRPEFVLTALPDLLQALNP